MEIIDLSMPLYAGMPVHKSQPPVQISVHATHEQWDGDDDASTRTPSSLHLSMGEHTGTHVDAINHMGREYADASIDRMSLERFYTMGCCLDLSHKPAGTLITEADLVLAEKRLHFPIEKGETVLIYTDHYRRHFSSEQWANGPGLSVEATRWLGNRKIAAFGVETMSPGIPGLSNKAVHQICGELDFTHYENLINLHLLATRQRFRFIGLPLPIKGGTGSPVRAVAVFEDNGN
ncbi:cyclase family protein [Robertkochia flava]|uniref:cyclase family protein n=1 Tax=Robertkochia flava TaxID=3447986 RepID=UPI001CCEA5DB|nr:cyclase family protein [Robertkochia marina]